MIQWHKVTWYSWALSGVVFLVVVPWLSFYFVWQYQEIKAINAQVLNIQNIQSVQNPQNFKTVKIGDATIAVQLLTTKPEWIQGLSGRTSLAPNTGLLFVFDKPDYWGIWMKDMNFPIDVLWITAVYTREGITSDLKVSDIVQNMSPASYPTDYKPHVPALYVLEIPAGTVKVNKIMIGQKMVVK